MKDSQGDFANENKWQSALVDGHSFLDVRAPVEFAEGSLPGAWNEPILTDSERHQVGLTYKEVGPEAAVTLGHQLVSGPTKEIRVNRWQKWANENPEGLLYCFRGGQRSSIAQSWLKESGVPVQRIEGGYKAVRTFLLKALNEIPGRLPLMSLSGQTGAGKTRVLRSLFSEPLSPTIIDLEGLAQHRGSAFGNEITPQPTQGQFENLLAVELLRAEKNKSRSVWMEDEARTIGRVTLGDGLFGPLRTCPLAVIEESREVRAQLILEEYVINAYTEHVKVNAESAYSNLSEALLLGLHRIARKLGGLRTQKANELMNDALLASRNGDKFETHLPWIDYLLTEYYDSFYVQHLERQSARIVFRGSRLEIRDFILHQARPSVSV